MTWTKLGDEWPEEARDLSDAAFRMHIEALCWSNRRLLDLRIPKRDVRRFAETDDPDLAVKECVTAGWWVDDGEVWDLSPRFPQWQQDAVQVEHRREKERERQRRNRRHKLDDHSLCLPGSECLSRRDVARESARDAERDARRDPGRDGTGRDGTGLDESAHARERTRTPARGRPTDDVRSAELWADGYDS